jgi:hypothetical protein
MAHDIQIFSATGVAASLGPLAKWQWGTEEDPAEREVAGSVAVFGRLLAAKLMVEYRGLY